MKYGLSEETITKINGVFATHPQVERAVLYGSRAKGNYKTGSDIDLTLEGDDLTSDVLAVILDELDELFLPYSIDLSIFKNLEHANLKEHIERVGQIFYQKDDLLHF